jgi:UDP-GlcNAc:undecaprenyl-phosphate GlcNAc-1-phosphate transferase
VLSFWLPAFAGVLVTAMAIASLRPVAFRLSLVDRPGGRKIHTSEVPVVGGLGMFLGLFVALGVLPIEARPGVEFSAICAAFVLIGLLDDRYGLSPWFRLAVQVGAAIWLAMESGLSARFLGSLLDQQAIVLLDIPAILLTGLLVAGGVNAFNMIDGIDGLAGTMGLIAMGSMAVFAFDSGLALQMGVAMAAAGAVAAFLIFNLPLGLNRGMRCFMGDAGSMLIGFIVAWLMLNVSQTPSSGVEPAAVLFAVAIPISDLLWVFGSRLRRGQSPFHADNSHLHHYLLKAGISHAGALSILTAVALAMSILGMLMVEANASGFVMLGLFLLCCAILVSIIVNVDKWAKWLPAAFMVARAGEVRG